LTVENSKSRNCT